MQDFVRSGKWGEVGDLGNTGLWDTSDVAQAITGMRTAVQSGADPIAIVSRLRAHFPEEASRLLGIENEARRQSVLNDQGGAGTPGERATAAVRKALGPELEASLLRLEEGLKQQRFMTLDELQAVGRQKGFIDPKLLLGGAAAGLAGLGAAALSEDREIRNGLLAAVGTGALFTAAGRAGLKKTFQGLDQIGGMVSTRIKNISEPIWHRAVDYEWRVLDRVFKEINAVAPALKQMPKAQAQQRVAQIHEQAKQLELARMFGKNAVFGGGQKSLKVNLSASIGNMVGEQLALGKITKAGADELTELLKSRHFNAEKQMALPLQHYRNITNAMLLGGSAPIQLGDAFVATYHQGILPAVVGVVRSLGPNKPISARDIGLAGHIAQEFDTAPTWSAKILDASLKTGLFSATDRFGKNVNLNAALFKAEQQAKTQRGIQKLREEYGEAFGNDFPQLIRDLQAKNRQSALVKSYLFHEISDAQPVSRLEMTKAAMDNPNLRLGWQLKSFALKQVDIARRDVWNEAKKGNYPRALKRAMGLAVTMGLAGMGGRAVSDFLYGNEVELDEGAFLENLAKTYFLSEYTRNKLGEGQVTDAVGGVIIPPYQMWDQILAEDPKAVFYLGLPGKLIYQHALGGAEKENARRQKRRDRELEKILEGK